MGNSRQLVCECGYAFLRNYEINFMMGLDVNRLISNQPAVYEQIQNIQIPESGLFTHLNGFDWVQVFQTVSKDGSDRRCGRETLCTLSTTR